MKIVHPKSGPAPPMFIRPIKDGRANLQVTIVGEDDAKYNSTYIPIGRDY